MPTITLSNDECQSCIAFGKEILSRDAQSGKDFGSKFVRKYDDNLVDTVEGKLAEVGFAKLFFQATGNNVEVDFKIYPNKLIVDYGQDLDKIIVGGTSHFVKCKLDIKATKSFSKWLLVESHKFWADVYVLCKINVPSDSEKNLPGFLEFLNTKGVTIDVTGFAYHYDIVDNNSKEPFIAIRAGESLFRPERLSVITDWSPDGIRKYMNENKGEFPSMPVTLKAPLNYCLPISKLRSSNEEWSSLFTWITNSLS